MQTVKFADNEDSQFSLNEVVLRAARLDDAEALTEMFNLPGVRHGTLRQPFQSVEKHENRWRTAAPTISPSLANGGERSLPMQDCSAGQEDSPTLLIW